MLFVAIYILASISVLVFTLWAVWWEGDDTTPSDLLKFFILSALPLVNILWFFAVLGGFLAPYMDNVILKGRKHDND